MQILNIWLNRNLTKGDVDTLSEKKKSSDTLDSEIAPMIIVSWKTQMLYVHKTVNIVRSAKAML